MSERDGGNPMYPPNRVASHDDFAMYNENTDPPPLHGLQAMFLHNPANVFWKSAEKLNFAHLSTDSLSSLGGTLSRNASRDSMASEGSSGSASPVSQGYTLRGMFSAWEGNIALNTAAHNPDDTEVQPPPHNDDNMPAEAPASFPAVFFAMLDAFLQNHATDNAESHVQFPRFC